MAKYRLTPEQLEQARTEGREMAQSGPRPSVHRDPEAPVNPWEKHFGLIVGSSVVATGLLLFLIGTLVFGAGGDEDPEPAPVVKKTNKSKRRSRLDIDPIRMRPNVRPNQPAKQPKIVRNDPPKQQPDPPQQLPDPPKQQLADAQRRPDLHAPPKIIRNDPPQQNPPEVPQQLKQTCPACRGTARLRCTRCKGERVIWKYVAKGGKCPRCLGKKRRICKKVSCSTSGHKHWSTNRYTSRRYECEPGDWGFYRGHGEFRCKGHAIICNFCGNTGKNIEKVRRRMTCSRCNGQGDRLCRRCAGAGTVDRIERKATPREATHELQLKDGRVLLGRVLGETEELVFFQSELKTRTYQRSLIKQLKKLPEKKKDK